MDSLCWLLTDFKIQTLKTLLLYSWFKKLLFRFIARFGRGGGPPLCWNIHWPIFKVIEPEASTKKKISFKGLVPSVFLIKEIRLLRFYMIKLQLCNHFMNGHTEKCWRFWQNLSKGFIYNIYHSLLTELMSSMSSLKIYFIVNVQHWKWRRITVSPLYTITWLHAHSFSLFSVLTTVHHKTFYHTETTS